MTGDRDSMPAWTPRLMVTIVTTIFITAAVVWAAWRLRVLLVGLLIALFLSFAMEPGVEWFVQRGRKRSTATGIVFVLVLVAVSMFFVLTVPPFATQATIAAERIPEALDAISSLTAQYLNFELSTDELQVRFGDIGELIQTYGAEVLDRVLGAGSAIGSFIAQFITVLLFTYYLVAEGPQLRRRVFAIFPPDRQHEVARIWELAIDKTGGYVWSRLILSLIAAVTTALFLWIIDVPSPIALGIWVGILSQFIPVVGLYLAAVVPILVALLGDPLDAVWVIVFLVAYQQVENVLLAPRITARTMSLHPALGFAAAIAGLSLMGVLGALIALPAAAIVQAFVSAYLAEHPVEATRLTEDPTHVKVVARGTVESDESDPGQD